jgi:hypothetical protein
MELTALESDGKRFITVTHWLNPFLVACECRERCPVRLPLPGIPEEDWCEQGGDVLARKVDSDLDFQTGQVGAGTEEQIDKDFGDAISEDFAFLTEEIELDHIVRGVAPSFSRGPIVSLKMCDKCEERF